MIFRSRAWRHERSTQFSAGGKFRSSLRSGSRQQHEVMQFSVTSSQASAAGGRRGISVAPVKRLYRNGHRSLATAAANFCSYLKFENVRRRDVAAPLQPRQLAVRKCIRQRLRSVFPLPRCIVKPANYIYCNVW